MNSPAAHHVISDLTRRAQLAHQAGDLTAAEQHYRRLRGMIGDHPELLRMLAMLAFDRGDQAGAVRRLRALISKHPNFPPALLTLSSIFEVQGKLADAVTAARRATQIPPPAGTAFCQLGLLLTKANEPDAAMAALRRATELDGQLAPAQAELGVLAALRGDFDEAVRRFESALRIEPSNAAHHFNLAKVLRKAGRLDDAIRRLEHVIRIAPAHMPAAIELALALSDSGALERAADVLTGVLESSPHVAKVHFNLAMVLNELGRPDRARTHYERACAISPDFAEAHAGLGHLLLQSLSMADDAVGRYRQAVDILTRKDAAASPWSPIYSAYLMTLHYAPGITGEEIARRHREWGAHLASPPRPALQTASGRPLRVGFVSADFCHHATGYFLPPLLRNRDPAIWEAWLYSNTRTHDQFTAIFQNLADRFIDVRGMDAPAIADRVRRDAIDILIDLKGHTRGNLLKVFSLRPAPIQATWLDYVGTTGMRQIDFLLSDRHHAPPDTEDRFVETVLRLPNDAFCYEPPQTFPQVAPAPYLANGHVTFGCFNALSKLSTPLLSAWARILEACPDARLVLAARGLTIPDARQRILGAFAAPGTADRVELLGPASQYEMLERYAKIDVALDSFPYSGGLTTIEALWMGVPVITWPGDRVAARHTTSHLMNIDLPQFVTDSARAYCDLAVRIARDPDLAIRHRMGLRERVGQSPLMDGKRFAADFAAILHDMTARAGQRSACAN